MAIIRHSVKRDAILDLLISSRSHPTAEEIYKTLRPAYPDLSLGTVYRNLRALAGEGFIRSLGVVNGTERFDGHLQRHAHFICEKCGAIQDVELPGGEALAREAERILGCSVTDRELKLRGLCAKCLEDTQA